MKRFIEFLNEETKRHEDVHHNPSITRLKALARNSKYGSARYAIDDKGDVWAGDAEHHVHANFGHGSQNENVSSHRVVGYIDHHNGNYFHNSFEKGTQMTKRASHPFIDKMQSKGIASGAGD